MIKVTLFDQHNTHFATFDMPELPCVGDTIEIGFPNEQVVKAYTVSHVVHQMVQIPAYTVESPSTYFSTCKSDPPWSWEWRLEGQLSDPKEKKVPKAEELRVGTKVTVQGRFDGL